MKDRGYCGKADLQLEIKGDNSNYFFSQER